MWELLSENVFNHVLQILSHIIVISIISTIIYNSCNMEVWTIGVTSFPDGKTSLLIDLLETNEPDLAVLKTKFLSITKLDKSIEQFDGDEKSVADDVVCRIFIEDMACYMDIVDDYTLKHHDIVGVRVNEKRKSRWVVLPY